MLTLLITAALNVCLGAALGVAGGLLGIGGGLIAIPVLVYLYGFDQHLAQGTALVMIAPNVLVGFYRYHQRHRIDLRSVLSISVFSMVTTYFAAKFATGLNATTLHMAFAVFLILLALYFGFGGQRPSKAEAKAAPADARKMPRVALPLLGILSGVMSGIFTVGGGLIVVPALVSYFRMEQTRAQGMALALVGPGSLIALLAYSQEGQVNWTTGLPMALGGIVTVSWGVVLAHRFSPTRLRRLFCLVLLGTAAMMLLSPR
ncbi:sulfite exporter TauE/SafE family protein [Massilia sp. CF038]|uniref:sulfite exporter TauE/SafE family protein n=1 Tax=Massilia sp. CF038 TaxID=1881045 RepID=UPI0009218AA7|nr:sulfite exporter TauE/SafE family protein [Massilia sp. CF038]SHH54693.1 hypothetical protein SAMN05428948_4395 [Massilia sp. CF038]